MGGPLPYKRVFHTSESQTHISRRVAVRDFSLFFLPCSMQTSKRFRRSTTIFIKCHRVVQSRILHGEIEPKPKIFLLWLCRVQKRTDISLNNRRKKKGMESMPSISVDAIGITIQITLAPCRHNFVLVVVVVVSISSSTCISSLHRELKCPITIQLRNVCIKSKIY